MKDLTYVELDALARQAEKLQKAIPGGKVEPGSHPVDFSVSVKGTVVKAAASDVAAKFNMNELLQAVILQYALTTDNPTGWLRSLLGMDGALGAILTITPEKAMASVPAPLLGTWNLCQEQAKAAFQAKAPRTPRAGNTTVVASIERLAVKK